jgi:hypothetical protein
MFSEIFRFISLLLFISLIIVSCQKADETKPAETKGADSLKAKESVKPGGEIEQNLGGLKTLMGNCYGNYYLSEFIAKGAEVILDKKKDDCDVSQLIGYAKDPYQIVVRARGFNDWSVADFAEKGARILVDCWNYSDFEIRSFINYAPADKKGNVIVYACKCCCCNILDYVKMGARLKINKRHEPFNILNYIDTGWKLHNKPLVEIDAFGFSCNWIQEFIHRGANVFVGRGFCGFEALQFAKSAKETNKGKVKIDGKYFSLKEISRFLDYDATVIVGKYYKHGLSSFEVAELIKKYPNSVVVVGDGYQAHEIAEFIRLGAKVIFISCTQDVCDINAYLSKVPPPSMMGLSQDDRAGKRHPAKFFDFYHQPKPCKNCPETNVVD